MSKRSDIKDASMALSMNHGLVYTKILGWIDLGHAQANDARRLKAILLEEKGREFFPEFNDWYFPIDYYQEMGKNKTILGRTVEFRVGVHSPLMVRSCLNWELRRRIALTIMMKTAYRFEAFQQSSAFSWHSDSGFSGEDLVSDLVGFYRIFGEGTDPLILAQPTSKEYALWIWDHYGAIGKFKNKEFRPLLFPQPSPKIKGLPRKGFLPSWLSYINPLTSLSDGYVLNRYNNKPITDLFEDKGRLNQEIYISSRRKKENHLYGNININMPPHLHMAPHTPVAPNYFTVNNSY